MSASSDRTPAPDVGAARTPSTTSGTEGAGASSARVPDFFVVGHPKSGTTALTQMLRRHPQVFMPMKEPRFFAPELRSRHRHLGPGKAPETLDSYLALFASARPGERVGEATPSYLRSHEAAARIAEVAPGARIVAILREPASFLRSFHLQSVHKHVERQKSFRRAIELEPARRRGRRIPRLSQSPQTLLYSDHVRYTDQLRRFHEHFGREQVLVLIYDDYRADNRGTLRRLMRFLDLQEPAEEPATVETPPLPGLRSLTLHQIERGVKLARLNPRSRSPALRAVNTVLPPKLHSRRFEQAWNKVVYKPAPPVDEELMTELRRRFKGEVEAVSEYLGRDLVSLWGYDRLG